MSKQLFFAVAVTSILLVASTLLGGCSQSPKPSPEHVVKQPLCNEQWYLYVEQKVNSSDSLGHGPDIGSTEWRSVVEFKLGIRGNDSIPALDTEQWCQYIDAHLKTAN